MSTLPFHLTHDDPEPTPAPVDSLELLTVKDVAALLKVHKKTVWSWVSAGVLPGPLHLGPRCVRWRRATIEAFLKDCEQNRR
jgi:excisionase family DNA binding protein